LKIFPSPPLGPTQPPIQWVAGRKADHSPPSSAEIKNAWSYTSSPQDVFMTWCLVKHADFTFHLLNETAL
jgi:hypothetical protein